MGQCSQAHLSRNQPPRGPLWKEHLRGKQWVGVSSAGVVGVDSRSSVQRFGTAVHTQPAVAAKGKGGEGGKCHCGRVTLQMCPRVFGFDHSTNLPRSQCVVEI